MKKSRQRRLARRIRSIIFPKVPIPARKQPVATVGRRRSGGSLARKTRYQKPKFKTRGAPAVVDTRFEIRRGRPAKRDTLSPLGYRLELALRSIAPEGNARHCKERPDSRVAARAKRGSGAGPRKFIPWCDKKRR